MRAVCLATAALVSVGAAASAEEYDAAHISFERVVGVIEIETGGVDRVSVEYDPGAGVVDAPDFDVDGDTLEITQLGRFRNVSCNSRNGEMTIAVNRGDRRPIEDFGRFIVRAPEGARVRINDGAVTAAIGDVGALEVGLDSCGDVIAGDVAGDADLGVNGSGDIEVGDIGGHLDAGINGSGDIVAGAVASGLDAAINGSGDIEVASVNGTVDAAIRGSGDISILAGQVSSLDAAIMGSGDVNFAGVAENVDLSSFGSGDVNVSEVTGQISRASFGSGSVNVGRD